MGLGESSESTLYLGKSLTEGSEATVYETITPTSHGLAATAGSFQSDDIDPSGKGLDSFRTRLSGGGDIGFHWRPGIFDSAIEVALRGAFGAAYSESLTISFAAPTTAGIQNLTDDLATGVLGNLNVGDTVLIGGAVADPANAGLRRVVNVNGADDVDVYNPGGAVSAGDAGVTLDHNGVATLGTTAAWLWVERVFSDGTNPIYSEHYGDLLPERFSLQFPASAPSNCTLRLQGDAPTLVHANGSAPIAQQRGGSDNPASTDRLVHGMDDVREVVVYNRDTGGFIVLQDLHNQLEVSVQRQIRQDDAVGTANIINTAVTRPTISGRINAYLNDVANGTSGLKQFLIDNPDNLEAHVIFGATDATAYGLWLDTVRFTASPIPVGGQNQPSILNAEFNAVDLRITRL